MSRTFSPEFDRPARLLHWLLAIAVTLNLFVLEEGEDFHRWTGYLAAALLFLRLTWGFLGGEASRFRSFRANHNPVAILVYAGMWLLVIGLGITGYLMGTDTYFGEEWLEELHERLSWALQAGIVLHLLGLARHSYLRKKHAWLAMFTGRRIP